MNTNLDSSIAINLIDGVKISISNDIELTNEEKQCLENVERDAKKDLSNILSSLALSLEIHLYIDGDMEKTVKRFCDLAKTVLSSIMTIHSAKLNSETYIMFNNIWRIKVDYIVETIQSTLLD